MMKAAIDFLFVLNAAVTNIRLYPPASDIIQRSIDRLHKTLEALLAEVPEVDFAESEKNLLVGGEPLPEKDQQKPQVRSFLSLMLDLGIRSLVFSSGVTREEISAFLGILGKPAQQMGGAGGLKQLVSAAGISHISIDEKIYVQMDPDRQILSGLDISDEDLVRVLVGEQPASPEILEQVRQLAAEPQWFARVFELGAQHLIRQYRDDKTADISTLLGAVIDSLHDLSDQDRQEIGRHIVDALADMDASVLLAVLTRGPDKILGPKMFEKHVRRMDPDRFEALAKRLEQMRAEADKGRYEERQSEAVRQWAQWLGRLRQDASFSGSDGQTADAAAKSAPSSRPEVLKEALARIMKGETAPFADDLIAGAMPAVISQLLDKAKQETAAALIDRMGEALLAGAPEVQKAAARIMAEIDERLEAGNRLEEQIALSKKLVQWIRQENEISEEYRAVTRRLERLSRRVIEETQDPREAGHILEAYYMIRDGRLTKDEAIQALAANMLQNVSTDHILDILLRESGKKQPQTDAGTDDIYTLVILGSTTVERLLDRLRDSQNMSERNRIVQAVSRMGKAAVGPVVERLGQDGPWYYLRNLALLLGRIGEEDQIEVLEPLLSYPDYRVQLEAVKSIQAINGSNAGDVLLKHADAVDPQLSGYVISVLGALRHEAAVPYLINVLTSKRVGRSKAEREEIRVKACEALGRIRAAEAVSVLEKIVRTRGFFRGDPESVRAAAVKALANIKRG